jgi:ribosomal protein S8
LTRKGAFSLPAGNTTLVFEKLSAKLAPSSLQVKGTGAITILSVIHQIDYLQTQQVRQELEKLQEKQQAINQKLEFTQAKQAVLEREKELLTENKRIYNSQNGVNVTELEA